jgi:hypothetical protein
MGAGDDRPPSRRRYLEAKRELAARDWEFVHQYADAKSQVVEAIIAGTGGPGRRDRNALTGGAALGTLRARMSRYFYFRCPA